MTVILLTLAGVVLPALLIAVVVRRWLEPVPWRYIALMLALALAFTARGVFTLDMPVPLDEVVRGYPYRGLFPDVQAKNPLTNDTVKQILPWMHTVREQFSQGRAPLWNPHLFSGYPLLGNGQSAPFSPVFLLTLFVPLPKQMVAMAALKLFIALLFGFLLVRRETGSEWAALFGSAVFAFSIFTFCFLYYPMTAVTLLLPAAAYAVLLSLRSRSRAPFVLVVLVIAALMAGGHPESVVHVAMAVLALVAVEWLAPQWEAQRFTLRDFGRVVVASLLGLLISAPAWLPVAEQAMVSLRVLHLEKVAASPRFPATALWAMTNPDGFGNPAHGNWNWIYSYTHVASLYLGLIVTALLPAAILSPRATRRDRLLLLVAFVLFLASMDWIFGRALAAVPPLSWVAHDRLRFVVCFLAGLIAARTVARMRNYDVAITAVAAASLLVPAAYVFIKLLGKTLTWVSITGIVALIAFSVLMVVRRRVSAITAFGLTTVELFIFTFDYNAMTDHRYYAPRLPVIERLKQVAAAAPPEPFRILGLDWVLLPNAAAHYGLEDIRGSDPMEWADYVRFFRVAEVKDESIDVKRIVDTSHPLIDFLNVRYLLTEPGASPGAKWQRLYAGIDGELYENSEFKARFFAPKMLRRSGEGWEAELAGSGDFAEVPLVAGRGLPPVITNPDEVIITSRGVGPDRFHLRIATPQPAFIASSQPALPGWEVRVNAGRTAVSRVNGAFLGFQVPAGSSEVDVRYRPLSWRMSLSLLAAGVAGMVLTLRLWNRVGG